MKTESDTPRTDDIAQQTGYHIWSSTWRNFARQLERELAEVTKQRDTLAGVLRDVVAMLDDDESYTARGGPIELHNAKQALAAAKGEKP